MKNLTLFPLEKRNFGQKDLQDRRKEARPFSPNCSTHLIFKAISPVFQEMRYEIAAWTERYAHRWGIQIFDYALNWNHGHYLIQAKCKLSQNQFSRNLCSAIAREANRKGLFHQRPYSRLVKWGRDFEQVLDYIELNRMEARGLKKDRARKLLSSMGYFQ